MKASGTHVSEESASEQADNSLAIQPLDPRLHPCANPAFTSGQGTKRLSRLLALPVRRRTCSPRCEARSPRLALGLSGLESPTGGGGDRGILTTGGFLEGCWEGACGNDSVPVAGGFLEVRSGPGRHARGSNFWGYMGWRQALTNACRPTSTRHGLRNWARPGAQKDFTYLPRTRTGRPALFERAPEPSTSGPGLS